MDFKVYSNLNFERDSEFSTLKGENNAKGKEMF